MIITILGQCCPAPVASNSTISTIKDLSPTIVPIAVAIISAWLAYKYALAKMQKETNALLQKELYSKQLEAYQHVWQLLAYTTNTENKQAILSYVRGKDKIDTYYLNTANAKAYIDALADTFYGKGYGVYISNKNIKANLFEYRGILYGFLLKEQNNTATTIMVEKKAMITRMLAIHDSLIKLLHEAVDSYPNNSKI